VKLEEQENAIMDMTGKHGEPYKKKKIGAMREYLPPRFTKVTSGALEKSKRRT
jgi:hypothetical protein